MYTVEAIEGGYIVSRDVFNNDTKMVDLDKVFVDYANKEALIIMLKEWLED